MYGLEHMIDIAQVILVSEQHRKVAVVLLICNPRINTASELARCCRLVNNVKEIQAFTFDDALRLGIPV